MIGNKAVDSMTDHRIDMILLSITVLPPLQSLLASSAASSARTTIYWLLYSAISSGSTAKMLSPLKS